MAYGPSPALFRPRCGSVGRFDSLEGRVYTTGMVLERSAEQLTDRLLAKRADQRLPLSGQWELTCRCNLRCVMCYTDCFNTPEKILHELSTDEALQLLGQLEEAGCLELTLTGGEPLARPDFDIIYREAHGKGFVLTVFSNGTLITPRIADLWAHARPKQVEISLHGLSKTLFERITTKPGSFDRCRQGIALLQERQIPVRLKTAAMTINRHEVLALQAFATSLGPTVSWSVGEYMRDTLNHSGEPYQYQLSEEELRAELGANAAIRDAHDRQVSQPASCGSGRQTFHIDAYGQLQLCSNNRRMSYDLRRGSFRDGFYNHLPQFACPRQNNALAVSAPQRLDVIA